MSLIRRWLSESISIALALLLAMLAMQAPAFTREYAAALLQVTQDARRDIEQRKASARQFYGITATADDQFVAALHSFEPSNAETLALSLQRTQTLQSAYDRVAGALPLLRPLVAARDALDDEHGYKATILRTLVGTYNAQLDFSVAAAAYGFAGLLIGSLLAQLVLSSFGALGRRLGRRRRRRLDLAAAQRNPRL
ncbi:MAG TPA: DUF2937 family protein [Stellaceae bacterium]